MVSLLATLLATAAVSLSTGTEADMAQQRQAFKTAYGAAQRGQWQSDDPALTALESYPLYPDLLGAYLRATIAEHDQTVIDRFIARYPNHPEARLLLRARLRLLAGRHAWPEFLEAWNSQSRQTGDTRLRCAAARAMINTGRSAEALEETLDLWRVGRSQPKECDPVFAYGKSAGWLNAHLHQERLRLALKARQFKLARYLARALPVEQQRRVTDWQRMYEDPKSVLKNYRRDRNPADLELLEAGLRRLAYRDGDAALTAWERLRHRVGLPAGLQGNLLRLAALGAAQRHEPEAADLLSSVPPGAVDQTVRHWRVRAALRQQDLIAVRSSIEGLTPQEASQANHRYWMARALAAEGRTAEARQMLAALAEERSLYGFLAADRLRLPYAFGHTETERDASRMAALLTQPDFLRARELFLVGLYGRGRQLWEHLMAGLPTADQAQAALLAEQWGWHSRAIATASRAGLRNDLKLRFPVPSDPWWNNQNLPVSRPLLFGLARSESLFMPDVRSSAGAIGLMQVMPATGREVARSMNLGYRGVSTLTDPRTNTRLGSEYLRRMLARFDQHKLLAAAAYNAGPHRVERWLPADEALPADIWMETIPFNETRGYVQRVLEAETIVEWRMGADDRRVSSALPPVQPRPSGPPQAARAGSSSGRSSRL